MKTASLDFKALFQRLVEDRSITVLIPPDKLATLTVNLHRRRRQDREIFASLGEDDSFFARGDSICCQVDNGYGLDAEGNIRVTFLIAPKPRQEYRIVESEETEDGQS